MLEGIPLPYSLQLGFWRVHPFAWGTLVRGWDPSRGWCSRLRDLLGPWGHFRHHHHRVKITLAQLRGKQEQGEVQKRPKEDSLHICFKWTTINLMLRNLKMVDAPSLKQLSVEEHRIHFRYFQWYLLGWTGFSFAIGSPAVQQNVEHIQYLYSLNS